MSDRNLKNSGIWIGRIYGVDLWIHWTLALWFGYVLYLAWLRQSGWETLSRTLVWYGAVFGSILIHELGHCYFAVRQGGGAEAVVFWPLGGLAYCDAPHLARNQFWVAAGGPIFQLIPTALAGGAILGFHLDAPMFPGPQSSYLAVALGAMFWWNIVLLVFNVLPMYPLDGGRMFQALLWGKLKSHGRATLVTIWASRITIILTFIAIFALDKSYSWPVGLILLWALFDTERLRHRLQAGEEGEDYIFGYDFSRGYTSLERTATRDRPKARSPIRERLRSRAREHQKGREAEIRRRVDLLLEKISREGLGSLSRAERKFLERAARRFPRSQG
jgi:stage IV sporulation protein FB